MGTLTIRDLDDAVKDRLRVQAATNGRSMEAEARAILAAGVLANGGPEAASEPARVPPPGIRVSKPATRTGGWSNLPRDARGPSTVEILDELRAERLDRPAGP
jgi:plasmid stability protein